MILHLRGWRLCLHLSLAHNLWDRFCSQLKLSECLPLYVFLLQGAINFALIRASLCRRRHKPPWRRALRDTNCSSLYKYIRIFQYSCTNYIPYWQLDQFSPSLMGGILKSTPLLKIKIWENLVPTNLCSKHDLPTPSYWGTAVRQR